MAPEIRQQLEVRSAGARKGSPSADETAELLDEKLYHLIHLNQQVITLAQQSRTEVASLRYINTVLLQKYRQYADAYKNLYRKHISTVGELEALKQENVQEIARSEDQELAEMLKERIAEMKNENLSQFNEQDSVTVKEEYENVFVNAEERVAGQEGIVESLKANEQIEVQDAPLPVIDVRAPKRERDADEQEEPAKKTRKRKQPKH